MADKKSRAVRKAWGKDDLYVVYVDSATVARLRKISLRNGWKFEHIIKSAIHLWDIAAQTSSPQPGLVKLERAAKEDRESSRGSSSLDVDGVVRRMRRRLEG